jgi:hypothetical protein
MDALPSRRLQPVGVRHGAYMYVCMYVCMCVCATVHHTKLTSSVCMCAALMEAHEEVFISGWWVAPELFVLRGAALEGDGVAGRWLQLCEVLQVGGSIDGWVAGTPWVCVTHVDVAGCGVEGCPHLHPSVEGGGIGGGH